MMKKYSHLSASTLLILFFISCHQKTEQASHADALPYYTEATFTPQWITHESHRKLSIHQIPDFELLNQNGDTITKATFKNKIYVANFFFTFCPGICPKMTENMSVIQEAFKDDDEVLLLSHSVTPKHDSPKILKAYAEAKGVINRKWHLVTGSREVIYDLGRNHYFVEEDLGLQKTSDTFLHTENFILLDRHQHIRGIYNGLSKTSIQQLIKDIYTLKSA